MIRHDFFYGGFPIGKTAPVLIFTENGNLYVAYNRYKLNEIINNNKVIKCVGVWMGKKNTDIFPLNPDKYIGMVPPEEHQSIDHATEIKVFYDTEGNFKNVEYNIPDFDHIFISQDIKLFNYIKISGLRYRNIYENIGNT